MHVSTQGNAWYEGAYKKCEDTSRASPQLIYKLLLKSREMRRQVAETKPPHYCGDKSGFSRMVSISKSLDELIDHMDGMIKEPVIIHGKEPVSPLTEDAESIHRERMDRDESMLHADVAELALLVRHKACAHAQILAVADQINEG